MVDKYQQLLALWGGNELPAGLSQRIIGQIAKEQAKVIAKRRFGIFFVCFVVSLVALIPTFGMVRASLVESGFTQFASLIFSDFGVLLSYWQNFAMTLLESLPVTDICIFSVTLLVFLESLKFLAQDVKTLFFVKSL